MDQKLAYIHVARVVVWVCWIRRNTVILDFEMPVLRCAFSGLQEVSHVAVAVEVWGRTVRVKGAGGALVDSLNVGRLW